MALQIQGYCIQNEISHSYRFCVYEGLDEINQKSVAIKTINREYPSLEDIARLRHEFKILHELSSVHSVINAVETQCYYNNIALILDYFEGQPLTHYLKSTAIDLEFYFAVAQQLVMAIGSVHDHQIIHQNICPEHILWNPETQQLKLISFDHASEIARQNKYFKNYSIEFLPYISPEQTGRINREVDYRTDYYSLGITLYQLLTGNRPFEASDAIGWVHSHIAKNPVPPHEINRNIPEMFSLIILKLMAKNAEDRYQSTQGLLHDLKMAQRHALHPSIGPFLLGTEDIPQRFQIPQKLYGRQVELMQLMQRFDETRQGKTDLMLVSGYSGIGKSSLINEIHKPIVEARGYFIEGKFDQYQRDKPYSAVIQSFQNLFKQLLTESPKVLDQWKTKLLNHLGENTGLMIEIMPVLEQIVGVPPPMTKLNPVEAQNRFFITFKQLVTVFAATEHPLVLFLDDLQWGDSPTFNLIRHLLECKDIKALMIIGAYRSNEIHHGHPLQIFLDDLKRERSVVELPLASLSEEATRTIVAETIHCPPQEVQAIAKIIHHKTEGNPFFVNELLINFYHEKLFTLQDGKWSWRLSQIQEMKINDNIVDFMVARLNRFQPETQRVLQLAACIGNRFDLKTLAVIHQKGAIDTAKELDEAIRAGVLIAFDDKHSLVLQQDAKQGEGSDFGVAYQFQHDRVQQAAYALIECKLHQGLHLSIGRLMLRGTPNEILEDHVIEIVSHLNQGRELIEAGNDHQQLMQLNLMAGKKAKASMAYQSALQYFKIAMDLLPQTPWIVCYEETFLCFQECSACAYLCGEMELAEETSKALLSHAQSVLEKAKILHMRLVLYLTLGKVDEAIQIGIHGLQVFGIKIVLHPKKGTILKEVFYAKWCLGGRQVSEIIDIPQMTNPEKELAIKMLAELIAPAYLTANQGLFALVILKVVNLSLRYGNCSESAIAYILYGFLLQALLGRFKEGYEFGKLGVELNEKLKDEESRCRVLALYPFFVHHWNAHASTNYDYLKRSLESGLRTGDLIYGGYAGAYIIYLSPEMELARACQEGAHYLEIIEHGKYQDVIEFGRVFQQFRLSLRGKTQGPTSFDDGIFSEVAALQKMSESRFLMGVAGYHICKLEILFLYEHYDEALEQIELVQSVLDAITGCPLMVQYHIYSALTYLALLNFQSYPHQKKAWLSIKKSYGLLKTWAAHNPQNYQHYYLLIEAEIAHGRKKFSKAALRYDQAIDAAEKHDYFRSRTMIQEVACRFCAATGNLELAQGYLKSAIEGYHAWGATEKVKHLERQYLQIAKKKFNSRSPAFRRESDKKLAEEARHYESQYLNLDTIMKAYQSMTSTVQVIELLKQLMTITLENAGAQTAILVLAEEDGSLKIQAESNSENDLILLQGIPLEQFSMLPQSILRYVQRSHEHVLLRHATEGNSYIEDPYLVKHHPKSILCLPIIQQNQLVGILYLENNLSFGAFTEDHVYILQYIATQAAISIENAKLYQIISSQNQQLLEADKVKDEFLANTSHELRTPLNGIIGISENLLDGSGGALNQIQRESVDLIIKSGKRLYAQVSDILDVSKLHNHQLSLQLKEVQLYDLVKLVIELSVPLIGKRPLVIMNRVSPYLPKVWGDENRLQQIFHNLIGNAIKFTEDGVITVCATEEAAGVSVSVVDTGIGIPQDKHEIVFRYFEQADGSIARKYGGSGLGLAITQQLVELHGSKITLESVEGKGSIFSFVLPIATESTAELLAPLAMEVVKNNIHELDSAMMAPVIRENIESLNEINVPLVSIKGKELLKNRKILVVDDDAVNRKVIQDRLNLAGYTVLVAENGYEALDLVESAQPSLVLLDLMMPGLNGYEVCARIRMKHHKAALPIILLTAKDQPSDLVKGFGLDANDYLTKPFNKDELIARVESCLHSLSINESYSRFVPHEFLKFLNKESILDVHLGDQIQQKMSILFSDIRSFTTLSERMTPQENFNFLNSYLQRIGPVIREYRGFIDKFIGDEIMALFAHRSDDAVQAAIAMQERLRGYNSDRERSGYAPIQIGIGINTGDMMLGTVGESNRMEGTVISDAVNLAARLEGLSKIYAVPLIISNDTFIQLNEPLKYSIRIIDRVRVRGKVDPVTIFEVLDGNPHEVRDQKLAISEWFDRGFWYYQNQEFPQAKEIFEKCLNMCPSDKVSSIYLQRIRGIEQGDQFNSFQVAEDIQGLSHGLREKTSAQMSVTL